MVTCADIPCEQPTDANFSPGDPFQLVGCAVGDYATVKRATVTVAYTVPGQAVADHLQANVLYDPLAWNMADNDVDNSASTCVA